MISLKIMANLYLGRLEFALFGFREISVCFVFVSLIPKPKFRSLLTNEEGLKESSQMYEDLNFRFAPKRRKNDSLIK